MPLRADSDLMHRAQRRDRRSLDVGRWGRCRRAVTDLRSKYHDLFRSDELRRIAPGFYLNLLGGGYFYLTGMYASISHLLEDPRLNTPAFVTAVLEELRQSMEDVYWVELMD